MESENKSASRWRNQRRLNALLAQSLRRLGREALAERVSACHGSFQPWRCEEGHTWATALDSCQNRLCSFEMRARSMRVQRKWAPVLDSMKKPKYMVISERNPPLGSLCEGIKHLWASFERLRHMRLFDRVAGGLPVLEITYNREKQSWHPHLNVLFDGPYIRQDWLVEAWQRATERRGRSVDIQPANQGTLRELCKYITKPAGFVDLPEAVDEFLSATWNRHFIRPFGSLYRLKLEPDFHVRENVGVCPDCRCPGVKDGFPLPPSRVGFDSGGVLRVRPHPAQELAARGPPRPTHKLMLPASKGRPAREVEYFENGWAVDVRPAGRVGTPLSSLV